MQALIDDVRAMRAEVKRLDARVSAASVPKPSEAHPRLADRSFTDAKLTFEQRQLGTAMTRAEAAGELAKLTTGTVLSHAYPDKIDIYGVRPTKTVANQKEAYLKLDKNPAHVETIYQMVKPLLTRFETEWVNYPEDAKVRGDVTRKVEVDGKLVDKKFYGVLLTRDEITKYQRDNALKENKGFKRFLYLNDDPNGDGEYIWKPEYGTHLHWLDLLLSHAWLANAGVTLDVNRHLEREYGEAADILFEYFFEHFEKLIGLEVERHSDHRYYMFEKQLHHNVAAHASLYRAFAAWWALPNRGGKARKDDVTALQHMIGHVIDGFTLHAFPPGLPGVANSEAYEFANYAHNNVPYGLAIGRGDENDTNGPGDVTYDREFASEIINFYLDGLADTKGRKITLRHIAALSNTYGRIYEPHQTPGTPFNFDAAETVTATKGTIPGGVAMLNNGQVVKVKYGGPARRHAFGAPSGAIMNGGTGGFWHFADPTAELYNLRGWLRRGKNHYYGSNRCDLQAVIKNPAHPDGKKLSWVMAAYLTTLLRPDVKLADIDLGTFTGGAFEEWKS